MVSEIFENIDGRTDDGPFDNCVWLIFLKNDTCIHFLDWLKYTNPFTSTISYDQLGGYNHSMVQSASHLICVYSTSA